MYKSEITQFRHNLFLADLAAVVSDEARESLGITAVVSFLVGGLWDASRPQAWLYRKNFYIIEQRDGAHVTDERMDEFVALMTKLETEGHTIVLHCHAGISRTPAFAIFWEMHKILGRSKQESELQMRLGLMSLWSVFEDEIKVKRPYSDPSMVLKNAMLTYLARKFGTVA